MDLNNSVILQYGFYTAETLSSNTASNHITFPISTSYSRVVATGHGSADIIDLDGVNGTGFNYNSTDRGNGSCNLTIEYIAIGF